MPSRFPVVVFAPNGGATFVVHLSAVDVSPPLPTPMPDMRDDGRLSPDWRWGGHQIDTQARVVHFTFVHRVSNESWTADVPFAQQ